jgi:hypothetical protein
MRETRLVAVVWSHAEEDCDGLAWAVRARDEAVTKARVASARTTHGNDDLLARSWPVERRG